MHVLLIHQVFVRGNQVGGTRHYEMARYLVEKGHQVTIITSQTNYLTGELNQSQEQRGLWATFWDSGIQIREVRNYGGYQRSFLHRILSFVSFVVISLPAGTWGLKPDVVIGTVPPILQDLSAYLVAKIHRVPLILEVRDLFWDYVLQTNTVRSKLLINIGKYIENWLYQRATKVIVNSPGFISYLESSGCNKERISLINNSVDTEQFTPEAACRSVWVPYDCQDRFIVLYAGSHGMLNDLGLLLEAAQSLQVYTEICICLLGDGKEKQNLMSRATLAGLENVVFLHPQPKDAMPAFIASADVCVATLQDLPILRTVYPNKVFDYMASGRPVILAIDGEIRKVIEDADAGIFVTPGDVDELAKAIIKFYRNRDLIESKGTNGRSYVVNNFNRLDQAKKLEQLLLDVVE